MAKQQYLFTAEHLFDIKPLKNFETLFSTLVPFVPKETIQNKVGRPLIARLHILNALIYKNLRGLPALSDLVHDLATNPSLALRCGFELGESTPTKETFSAFLRDTPHDYFATIKKAIVIELIKLKELKATFIAIDSAPIKANVKQNNLKTSSKDRFNKLKFPKGDPDARLGVIITYNPNDLFKRQVQFFWGYRTHVLSDAITELPIIERTLPANVHDSKVCIPLLKELKEFKLKTQGVTADAAFDSQRILKFIFKKLKAKPYIARNPRHKVSDFPLSRQGQRLCIAGLPMMNWGKFKDDIGRIRRKFVCPIKYSQTVAKQYPSCPVNHPKFAKPQGCTAYLRIDPDIRNNIDYGSAKFKKIYNLRTSAERVFSRLINLALRNIPVKGMKAISNYITIAHISVLLVALTAIKTGNKDKIRYFKSFIKDL
ncbi:MAG: transposase [Elusimicrobia bacterium]|nr:transposase [Candidatus Liberimonas magnetica]